MTGKELAELINSSLELNWKPKAKYGSIWLENPNEKLEHLYFGSLKSYKGFKIIGEINAKKAIPEVSNILKKFYSKHQIEDPAFTLSYKSSRNEELVEHEIIHADDILPIQGWLRTAVYEEIFSFFTSMSSLEDIYDLMIKTDDLSQVFETPVDINALIIHGLLKSEHFESYSNDVFSLYQQQSEGPYKAYFEKYYVFL